MVADQIRERILRGDLNEGDLLPKEAELREQYPVNVQSLREALRILEAEGLVRVRRGNRGGAVVHRPTPGNVAYSLSMVLAMSGTDIDDVGRALHEVEPMCAALCAERGDRATEVVPVLRALHEESLSKVDDLVAATALSRRFHESVVKLCGNRSLIVLAGASRPCGRATSRIGQASERTRNGFRRQNGPRRWPYTARSCSASRTATPHRRG